MENSIIFSLLRELKIPSRIIKTLGWYLLSIMLPSEKHNQVFASKISGKASSLFSNLLRNHSALSEATLNRASRRVLSKLMKKRAPLAKGSPWTIAILIDATIHRRTSRHCENSQFFNHGSGHKFGHQWTNVGLFIAGQYIPLPPIPFYTTGFCSLTKKAYKTEGDKVSDYIRTLNLKGILGDFDSEEIVFLMDSGYDIKKIQNTIISRGYDFIIALRKDRSMCERDRNFVQVGQFFKDGRRKWKTIRVQADGGKRRSYRTKQREGLLKGVKTKVQLICSEKSKKQRKHFACTDLTASEKTIIRVYQYRWKIEVFHREIKSYLGLEDTAAHSFNAVRSHLHWVYVSYILLLEMHSDKDMTIKERQLRLEASIEARKMKEIILKTTQVGSKTAVKSYCLSAIERINMRVS